MSGGSPTDAARAGGAFVHLAMTGCREAWPGDTPFWLLGPHCAPGARPGEPAQLQGILEYPWSDRRALRAAQAEARRLRRGALEPLADRLNAVHGTHFSVRYWELLIGPWLFYFTNLVYQQYQSLLAAKNRFGEIETIGLDKAEYELPSDTLRFIYAATDDTYNLQLATRICAAIGIPIRERIRLEIGEGRAQGPNPERFPRYGVSLARKVRYKLLQLVRPRYERAMAGRARVVLRRSYLPGTFEAKLALRSGARVLPVDPPLLPAPARVAPDAGMRATLRTEPGGDEAASLLATLIPEEIPGVFVEDYRALRAFAEREYRGFRPDAVVSTIAWQTDEAFKHFAGRAAEAGAVMVGGQHGGTGVLRDYQVEEFERELVDRYLTWGWTDPADGRCVPTPATRLVDLPRRAPGNTADGILYIGTVALRYPLTLQGDFSGYPELQARFFDALGPDLTSRLEVRPHPTDFGWRIVERLTARFPGLELQDARIPFSDALRRARLYVCDHLSTSYTEALATNTPTVMFWDPESQAVRDSEAGLFDRLRSCGVVHDTPEGAAAWIGRVYADVDGWWFAEECQSAVRAFCHRHARVTGTPVSDWLEVLEDVRTARSTEVAGIEPVPAGERA
jgi:putative transferase (TIGR04331 family)